MAAVCSICKKKDQRYVPVEWCPECQKALCSSCSQRHKQDKSSKDHGAIRYDNYLKLPPFIKKINQNCPDHNESYQYLCREHDELICNKCRQTKHKKCKETPILKEIVKKVKTSNAYEDVTREMKETSEILQNGILGQRKNLNRIQNQRKEMARNVEDTMKNLMSHLKKVKQNMLSDIDAMVKENENKILETIQTLQTMESQINEINQVESIKLYASNLQIFIGIKEMEKVVEGSKTGLTELSDSGALDCPNLTLVKAKNIETLLTNDKLFGEIIVTKSPNNLSIDTSKLNQGQIMVYTIPEQLHLQQEVKLEGGYYCGCCTLPSGLMVITDNSKHQLKLINPDGTMKSTIRVKDDPYNVTVVDNNQVAVSYRWAKTISIVDVSREKVTKTLSTGDGVWGISYIDGHIIFCVPDTGIKRININTKTINPIIDDYNVTYSSYIVAGSDRICYTCPNTHTVTVLDSQYNVIFKYHDRSLLEYPCGVTIDSYNNIYVIGFRPNNLVVISSDGDKAHQLLTRNDGLSSPSAIHYCHHTNQLIVVADRHNTVHKHSLGGR